MAATIFDAPQQIRDHVRVTANSRILVLEHTRPSLDAAPLLLDQPQYLVGSGAECPIRLPANGINSRHALLVCNGPQVVIKALDRRTWLNGYPVTESRVREGDLVAIGPVEFRVRRADSHELVETLPPEPNRSQLEPDVSRDNSRGQEELSLLDSGRSMLEAGRSQLDAVRLLLDTERSQLETQRTQFASERAQFDTLRSRLDADRSQFELEPRAAWCARPKTGTQLETARAHVEGKLTQLGGRLAQLEADQTRSTPL